MTRPAALAAAIALGLVAAPGQSFAHHSFAMYDTNRAVTLKGAVKAVQWTNPHVVVWVEAAPAAGGPSQTWTIEATSPGNLGRIGWTRKSLKAGDKVEVEIAPLRDGGHGGSLRKAKLVGTGQAFSGNWVQPGKP
ncbi:DUF6152 family protein [Phenylobacterium sp. LjRoot225]|uniref:DUF6152 family protein n=1 Tax=Phenylobacterium sp. LjRoot225 TaxID=3342285 RepID=UPI003ECD38B7